jgi:hypothetical protein
MKSKIFGLAILAAILVYTNPSETEYVAWLRQRTVGGVQGGLGQFIAGLLAGPVIENTTIRANYIVLSFFETELDQAHKVQAIGALSHFFVITSPPP